MAAKDISMLQIPAEDSHYWERYGGPGSTGIQFGPASKNGASAILTRP